MLFWSPIWITTPMNCTMLHGSELNQELFCILLVFCLFAVGCVIRIYFHHSVVGVGLFLWWCFVLVGPPPLVCPTVVDVFSYYFAVSLAAHISHVLSLLSLSDL